MILTEEEIEKATMWKRPDCQYCYKKEVGLVFFSGKISCGECLAKLYEWQQRESSRIMDEVINNERKI